MGAAPIAQPKPTRRSRLRPAIPPQIRKEVSAFARAIGKRYRDQFHADPKLKRRTTRLMLALLPPRPRRTGRPRNRTTTRAITTYNRLRRKYPVERSGELWTRACHELIPGYDNYSELEQRALRDELRQRAKRRLRKRPRQ